MQDSNNNKIIISGLCLALLIFSTMIAKMPFEQGLLLALLLLIYYLFQREIASRQQIKELLNQETQPQLLNEAYSQADQFFNLSLDMLVIGNFDGYFTYLNAAWEKILGFTCEELKAQPFSAFLHPEDLAITTAAMAKLAEGMPVTQFENRYRCQDNSYKWLSWTAIPFIEEKLIYAIARDVSDSKRVKQALQQQIERERMVAVITQQIRQSLNLNQILITTVTAVRQLLQADRVLIFCLCADGTGRVVAESVSSEWPVTWEMMFPDENFPPECYEFYCQGKSRIVPDVAKDEWASCLVEFMQQVGVKSKVVVPIVQGKNVQNLEGGGVDVESTTPRLWGTLIAHACSDYRQWQQAEVDLLASLANQLALAIQQADLYQQLQAELAERQHTEAKLRQSEARLAEAQRLAHIGNWELDLITQKITWSTEVFRLFGRDLQQPEPTYPELLEYIHPDDRALWAEQVRQAVHEGACYEFDLQIVRPDAVVRNICTRGQAIVNIQGEAIIMFGTFQDITERKRSEAELRQAYEYLELKVQQRTAQLARSNESLQAEITERQHLENALRQREQEFKALVENAPDIIARLNHFGSHLYINPAIEQVTGISPKTFIGKTHQELGLPEEFVSTWDKAIGNVFATGDEETIEFNYPTPQIPRYYQARLVPEFSLNGDVASILAIGCDITELKQTEEALRVREHQLRAIFENVVDAIVIADDDGYYVEANPAASKLFGLPHSQIISKKITDFLHPDFNFELAWRIFKEQQQETGSLSIVRPDGTVRNVEYSAIANFLPGLHLAVLHDITERLEAEAALREREQQLTAIAANIPGAVYRCLLHADGSTSLVYVSAGVRELIGIEPNQAIAHPQRLLKLIHPEEREHFNANKRIFKQTLQPLPLEFRVISKTGEIKWVRDNARYLPSDRDGEVIVDGVILDISERKQAELALWESQRLLQQISDTTPVMIYIFDLIQQRNVYLNHYGIEFFGRPVAEIQELGVQFFSEVLLREEIQHLDASTQRLITAKEGEVIENKLQMKNAKGEWRWFHVWEVIFTRTAEGKPQQILGTAIDITEQKRSEDMRFALEAEQKLRKLQLRFFSMASHEFRTPISTILVTAQLLENCAQDWLEEKRLRNLNRIATTAKNMAQLLDDILTFNRAETGKLEFNPHPIDLDKFCKSLVGDMQVNAGSQYQICFTHQGSFKKTCLDEKMLRSVLTNLLSNAIKYSPQGGNIYLTLICKPTQIIFQVQDEGIGIPEEYEQHLFEPFHRGTNIGNIPGTGLGLTVVKKCLDIQKGEILINSEIGVGTIVTITIPAPTGDLAHESNLSD